MPELFFPSQNLPVDALFDSNDKDALDAFMRHNMRNARIAVRQSTARSAESEWPNAAVDGTSMYPMLRKHKSWINLRATSVSSGMEW